MKPALFLTLAACIGIGTPVSAAVSQEPAAAKPAKEKKICRREVNTGSIMPKTTCRSQKEWDQLTDNGQRSLDEMRERSQRMPDRMF